MTLRRAVSNPESAIPNPGSVRILGIDPGSQRTGVGIVDIDTGGRTTHVFHTALNLLDNDSFPLRLKQIFDELCAIVAEHRPDEVAIERVFMARNPDSALKLGHARGARTRKRTAPACEHAARRAGAHARQRFVVEKLAMIGRLRGILASKQPPWLVIDVGGVGYEVEAPMSTVFDLPEVGREVALHVHYAAKEDTVSLYGFLREAERTLFRTIQKVSGIGAKTALAVLSGVSTDEFARLVQAGDIAALTRIPGIGKKTAERIIVELRDRVDGMALTAPVAGAAGMAKDPQTEASSALQQLGYKPAEAARLVKDAFAAGDDAEAIIRKALKAALR